jgi:SAM-dependent methyltransferase
MHKNIKKLFRIIDFHAGAILRSGKVIEFGSLNTNGTIRDYFLRTEEYIGVDWREGDCVDVVKLCHEYHEKMNTYFDVVVSTEMLEHDPYWMLSLQRMCELVRYDGFLILSWANSLRKRHHVDHSPLENYYMGLPLSSVVNVIQTYAYFKTMVQVENADDCYFIGVHKTYK